jgi:hypothetical protein
VLRREGDRALTVTPAGTKAFARELGIDVERLAA